MSQLDKLKARIYAKPKDFTWDELVKLLATYGFNSLTKSKTAGSRQQFYNPTTQVAISLHKPTDEVFHSKIEAITSWSRLKPTRPSSCAPNLSRPWTTT